MYLDVSTWISHRRCFKLNTISKTNSPDSQPFQSPTPKPAVLYFQCWLTTQPPAQSLWFLPAPHQILWVKILAPPIMTYVIFAKYLCLGVFL